MKVQDEKLKLDFFAALGNTVVAKDLDQATCIAYDGNQKFRLVVTVDGALCEKSGMMSGGGNKPRGGTMGTSIRANSVSIEDVAKAKRKLSERVDKLNGIHQRITNVVRPCQTSEKAVAALEMELVKTQKEAALLLKKEELERLKQLRTIISAEEKEINRLIGVSKQLKEKALEHHKNIENAGDEKLKSQKSKVKKI